MPSDDRRRWWRLPVVGAIFGGLALVVWFGLRTWGPLADFPTLVMPGGPMNQITDQLPAYQYPRVILGDFIMCLDRPGSVEVRRVVRLDGDLELGAFAFQDNPFAAQRVGVGSTEGTLASNRIVDRGPRLTRVCGSDETQAYDLVVEIKASSRSTSTSGFRVVYVSDGRERYLDVKYRTIMCQDDRDPVCVLTNKTATQARPDPSPATP